MSRPSTCPACHSPQARLVESVTVEALASAWTREKCHGDGVGYESIHQFLLEDLGKTKVEFWQCQECEMEFSHPMRSWSASHYPIEQHYLGYDHEVALSDLASMPQSRVLDIGCADGQFLERGAALGHEMVGIDFASEDVEAAKARGLDARVADVNEIGKLFGDQPKFDVICLFQIIEHLNEPDKIFSQLNTIAAPNARLIIGCPSPLRYTRVFEHQQRIERSDFWDYPPQHTLRWTAKALKVFLLRNGWKVQSVLYEPFSIHAAAAHLAGINNLANGSQSKLGRRFHLLALMLRMVKHGLFGSTTGIRLVARGCRVDIDHQQ